MKSDTDVSSRTLFAWRSTPEGRVASFARRRCYRLDNRRRRVTHSCVLGGRDVSNEHAASHLSSWVCISSQGVSPFFLQHISSRISSQRWGTMNAQQMIVCVAQGDVGRTRMELRKHDLLVHWCALWDLFGCIEVLATRT